MQFLQGGWHMAAVSGALMAAMGAGLAHAEDKLPQRNLVIEWRMNGQTQGQQRNQDIQTGQVILDSNGKAIGRTSIGLGVIQTENQSEDDVQEVRVLNGARAKLYVGHTQPYTVWQWAMTAANATPNGQATQQATQATQAQKSASSPNYPAAQAVAQTVWIDIGKGLNVRPRWPGGKAPVIVEFEAQSRQPMQAGSAYSGQTDPDGQSRRFEVGSTLAVPMGQWTVVARSGSQVQRQPSGTLSTRDLDSNQSDQLEIRITAP